MRKFMNKITGDTSKNESAKKSFDGLFGRNTREKFMPPKTFTYNICKGVISPNENKKPGYGVRRKILTVGWEQGQEHKTCDDIKNGNV